MQFIKRLVILSGNRTKGTLSLERNAFGLNIKLNTYGAAILDGRLCINIDGKSFSVLVNDAKKGTRIENTNSLDKIHAAVFDGGVFLMYGTNEAVRFNQHEINRMLPLKLVKVIEDEKAADEDGQVFSKRTTTIHSEARKTEAIKAPQNEKSEANIKVLTSDRLKHKTTTQDNSGHSPSTPATAQYQDDAIAETNYFELDKPKSTQNENIAPLPMSMSMSYIMKLANSAETQSPFVPHRIEPAQNEKSSRESIINQNLDKKNAIEIPENHFQSPEKIVSNADAGINKNRSNAKNQLDNPSDTPPFLQDNNTITNPFTLHSTNKTDEKNSHIQKSLRTNPASTLHSSSLPPPRLDRVAAVKSSPHIEAREGTFLEKQGDEIEALFNGEHKREEELEKMLPKSRWIRINFDGERYYVIGLIDKDYLCYGLPDTYSSQPPKELEGYCWWLPLRADNPTGRGYWIMYQDLKTGEAVFPPK